MVNGMNEATASFLQAAGDDLQRQLGSAGVVEGLTLESAASDVTIVAAVRVGSRTVRFRGTGENLVAAYASLTRSGAEPILASAFRELVSS